jgi:REP element-mobilizing transposase RayT
LVNEFRRAEQQGLALSLAWVVMPDHFHWLVELKCGTLASLMKQVKASSSREINRGRLWQQGYHDKAVRREEDIRGLARYIVANPLRAGLVTHIGDYPLWDAAWV